MDSEFNTDEVVVEPVALESRFKKWTSKIGPILVLVASFIVGFIYFFNLDIIARYYMVKQGFPLDIDKMNLNLSGHYEFERLKYIMQTARGVENEIKVQYLSGNLSLFKILFSNTLKLDSDFKGVKIPFTSGMISGGNWKINSTIQNISKIAQNWSGDLSISTENSTVQYTVMNTNYVAEIKNGKIRGIIRNGLLQLDTSEIITDIGKIVISGNTTINAPFNVNIQLTITPSDKFGEKYPNEKSMLSAVMQKETSIIVNLSGSLDNLRPQVKNLNLPGI